MSFNTNRPAAAKDGDAARRAFPPPSAYHTSLGIHVESLAKDWCAKQLSPRPNTNIRTPDASKEPSADTSDDGPPFDIEAIRRAEEEALISLCALAEGKPKSLPAKPKVDAPVENKAEASPASSPERSSQPPSTVGGAETFSSPTELANEYKELHALTNGAKSGDTGMFDDAEEPPSGQSEISPKKSPTKTKKSAKKSIVKETKKRNGPKDSKAIVRTSSLEDDYKELHTLTETKSASARGSEMLDSDSKHSSSPSKTSPTKSKLDAKSSSAKKTASAAADPEPTADELRKDSEHVKTIAPTSSSKDDHQEPKALTKTNGQKDGATKMPNDAKMPNDDSRPSSSQSNDKPAKSKGKSKSSPETATTSTPADAKSVVDDSNGGDDSDYSRATVPRGFLSGEKHDDGSQVEIKVRIETSETSTASTDDAKSMVSESNDSEYSKAKVPKGFLNGGSYRESGSKLEINVRIVVDEDSEKDDSSQVRRSGRARTMSLPLGRAKRKSSIPEKVSSGGDGNETNSSSSKHRASLNDSYQNRNAKTGSVKSDSDTVPDNASILSSSNGSAKANNRKRKRAVISDSDEEMQNLTKAQGTDYCPSALVKIFENDFGEQDHRYSSLHRRTLATRVWVQTPREIKQSIPNVKGENADQELLEWKVKHFGEHTRIPVSIPSNQIPAVPDCLVPLLQEDVARNPKGAKMPNKLISIVLRRKWAQVSQEAKYLLPHESEPDYFSKLKNWKLQHIPDAADDLDFESPQRKRSKSDNAGNIEDLDGGSQDSGSQDGKRTSLASPRVSERKRPKPENTGSIENFDEETRASGSQDGKSALREVSKKITERVVTPEAEVGWPPVLKQIFESDFAAQDPRYSEPHRQTLCYRVWKQTPNEIKQTIPIAEGDDAVRVLQEWKVKHFGERTRIPLGVRGCPDVLVPLLQHDFARHPSGSTLQNRELGQAMKRRWVQVSQAAKDCLPKEDDLEYFSKLKNWKLQHIPDAVDELNFKTPKGSRLKKLKAIEAVQSAAPNSVTHVEEIAKVQDVAKAQGIAPLSAVAKAEDIAPLQATEGTLQPVQSSEASSSSNYTQVQKEDPNEFYIEEEAHLYHNPPLPSIHSEGVKPQDLKAIPPPSVPFNNLPNTGKCKWSWDKEQRILLADFSCSISPANTFAMDPIDEAFFLQMMERNDLTLISEGLISPQSLNPDLWDPRYLRRVLEHEYYHKFRRFDTVKTKDGFEEYTEVDGLISMKVGDYIAYLEKRQDYLQAKDGAQPSFSFVNHEGKVEELNVGTSALYMIDVDTNRLLPKLNANFLQSFRYHGVLPGGSHCLMNSVTSTARPFMGPNLYVTPPATFTHFHQDGHGTVDSGHLCISGFNEVIMLRRLTERHKQHALMILTGDFGGEKQGKDTPTYFDGLYEEPHGDQLGEKPSWPSEAQIERCRKMGYCPTVCMVKPGQLIHINKGRLHAFRKMSTAALPEGDCHKKLREKTIEEYKLTKETLCVSIAWDWMYRGVSEEGINREISSVLEAVVLNRKNGRVSLAIPEFSLFQMAKVLNPGQTKASKLDGFIGFGSFDSLASKDQPIPDSKTISRGILPSLRYMMDQQITTMSNASSSASKSKGRGQRVTIAKRPNTHEDPLKFPLDPYGLDGFACKLCSRELSNVYYHCDGCELLLSKDFNICRECHGDQRFMCTIQMHPTNPKRHASLNHTGKMNYDRESRCPCKNGPVCGHCNFCLGCSCRCHTWFTLHSRMFGEEEGKALLSGVENAAECVPCDGEKSKKYGDLLAARLEAAAKVY